MWKHTGPSLLHSEVSLGGILGLDQNASQKIICKNMLKIYNQKLYKGKWTKADPKFYTIKYGKKCLHIWTSWMYSTTIKTIIKTAIMGSQCDIKLS